MEGPAASDNPQDSAGPPAAAGQAPSQQPTEQAPSPAAAKRPPAAPASQPHKKPLARLLDIIITYSYVLSAILALVGVLGFCALPAVKRNTHFDENALLAGSTRPTLRCAAGGVHATHPQVRCWRGPRDPPSGVSRPAPSSSLRLAHGSRPERGRRRAQHAAAARARSVPLP
jgi:hypothetical protein